MSKPGEKRDETHLTPKQRKFLREYLATNNATRAYMRVYDTTKKKSASVSASKLLRSPICQAYLKDIEADAHKAAIEKYNVSVDRIYSELCCLAYYNMQDFYDKDGNPIPIEKLSERAARAVMGFDAQGRYRLPDKGQNLERLAKTQGMFDKEKSQQALIVINAPNIHKPPHSGA